MTQRPVVVSADVHIEGRIPEYMADLLATVDLHSPQDSAPTVTATPNPAAVAWISRLQPLTATEIDQMPNLKLITAWGVGYNHIDVAAATARRIPVCINPVFTRSVAEAALTLIFNLAKRLSYLVHDAHTGRRPLEDERGLELRGKTLGLVGFGRIGEDIGRLCHCLEMSVIAYDPYRPAESFPKWAQAATLDELLPAADFVVAIAALTPETRHMLGRAQFARMKPSAYFINVGRGPLVDEAALYTALQEGRIAGAGLDVWEQEPPPPDHPLLLLDNVIGTPHKLASTWDSLRAICEAIQANVFRVLAGDHPENMVNPEIYGDTL